MTINEAINLSIVAINEAWEKHGHTFEEANHDRRNAVLSEEVGEVAMAVNDIHRSPFLAKDGTTYTADLGTQELKKELAQVAATALRWLTTL